MNDDELHAAYVAAMRERLNDFTVNTRGCHIWGGYIDSNGYGRVYDPAHGGLYWVHRVAYEVYNGPIEPGYEIDHTCETPPCIRPKCLESVTRAEHVRRTYQRLGKDDLHLMAAELRHLKLTYAEIAEVMGLAGKSSALGAVQAAIRKGLISSDEAPPARRITESEREDIRALWAIGVPQGVLAQMYEIHNSQVSRICGGATGGRHPARAT